jgi:DNA polymerase-3 subunit epsilon
MLFSHPLAIVDLETTGGNLAQDRITEVGLILVDGERVERFSALVNPGRPIPAFISGMTGIDDAMVATAPPFAELAPMLFERLQGRLLIAHNVRFDYGVLKNEFRRIGTVFRARTLCTVKLSRKLYPQFYKHNLDAVIERHGIVLPERHRAMADAEGVYRFLLAAGAELGELALWQAAEGLIAQHAPPRGMDADTFEALPDVPGVYCIYDRGGLPLYVGRDGNIMRGVLAHYVPGKGRAVQLADEAGRVEWHETVGEFGAALEEIVALKTLRPRLNPKGRLASEVCALRLADSDDGFLRPQIVAAGVLAVRPAGGCYGLFRSPREAKRALKQLAEAEGLCQWVLGIERMTSRNGHPCAGRGSGRCQGACIGLETPSAHNRRLQAAMERLRLADWPVTGALAIVEHDPVSGRSCEHVFEAWCYLGSRVSAEAPLEGPVLFDPDLCKLLAACFRKPVPNTRLLALDAVMP